MTLTMTGLQFKVLHRKMSWEQCRWMHEHCNYIFMSMILITLRLGEPLSKPIKTILKIYKIGLIK